MVEWAALSEVRLVAKSVARLVAELVARWEVMLEVGSVVTSEAGWMDR